MSTHPYFFEVSCVPQQNPIHLSGLFYHSTPLSDWQINHIQDFSLVQILNQVTGALKLILISSIMIEAQKTFLNIFYPVCLRNSGHVTQFAEYLLHILYSISYLLDSIHAYCAHITHNL